MLAHAYARMDVPHRPLLRAASTHVADMDDIAVGNLAWAHGMWGDASDMEREADAWAARIGPVRSPQCLSLVAWAIVRTKAFMPGCLDAIESCMRRDSLSAYETRHIARCLWALAASHRKPNVAIFRAAAEELLLRPADEQRDNLGIVVWSFATAGLVSPALFTIAKRRLLCARPEDVAQLLWAHAIAGCDIHSASITPEILENMDAHEVAMVAWAVAVLGVARFPELARAACARCVRERLTGEQANSLAQLLLSARVEGVEMPRIPPHVHDQIAHVHGRLESDPSGHQRKLSHALASAGWAHEDEVAIEGCIVVDMAARKTKEVVEYDGPSHDVIDVHTGSIHANGSTVWRMRVLRALGWRVVQVSWRDTLEGARLVASVLERLREGDPPPTLLPPA